MPPRSLIWPDPRVKPPFGAAEVDWGHPLARKLIGYWPLNEGAGAPINLAAVLGGRGMSTLEGAPTWQSAYRDAPVMNFTAGSLDAAKLGVNTTDFSFSGVPASIGCVWKSSAVNTFALGARILTSTGYDFLIGSAGVAGDVTFRTDTFTGNVWSGTADGRFHHITATFSPTTCVQYGDGVLRNTNAGINISANSQALYIARRNTNYYTGQVGLVYVYSRALPAAEARWLYHEPYAMLRPIVRRRYFVAAAAASGQAPRSMHHFRMRRAG